MSIDTRSLVLAMPAVQADQPKPQQGEKVRLELSLPVAERNAGAKCLELRARVAEVTELNDGSRQITFTFRKASFKDRVEGALPNPAKAAAKGWRM